MPEIHPFGLLVFEGKAGNLKAKPSLSNQWRGGFACVLAGIEWGGNVADSASIQ
jgi:hypothetical protein